MTNKVKGDVVLQPLLVSVN